MVIYKMRKIETTEITNKIEMIKQIMVYVLSRVLYSI